MLRERRHWPTSLRLAVSRLNNQAWTTCCRFHKGSSRPRNGFLLRTGTVENQRRVALSIQTSTQHNLEGAQKLQGVDALCGWGRWRANNASEQNSSRTAQLNWGQRIRAKCPRTKYSPSGQINLAAPDRDNLDTAVAFRQAIPKMPPPPASSRFARIVRESSTLRIQPG